MLTRNAKTHERIYTWAFFVCKLYAICVCMRCNIQYSTHDVTITHSFRRASSCYIIIFTDMYVVAKRWEASVVCDRREMTLLLLLLLLISKAEDRGCYCHVR